MRAALVREADGLVVNIIEGIPLATDPRFVWTPPAGHIVILAQRQDGSYRYVGPGFRYDRASDRFLVPQLSAPDTLAVGQQGQVTLRWVNEDLQPVAYQQPITLRVEGQAESYTPGPDGSVTVPITISTPGTYTLEVIETIEAGQVVVLAAAVVTAG
jgi:hypothetical protein